MGREKAQIVPVFTVAIFFLSLLLLVFGGLMNCTAKRGEEMKFPYWKGKYPVLVIAHRGFSGAAPENTLAAFRKALEAGSDMIELDIHLSRDGMPVVIHDETLERTTKGQGRVADHTLEELKKLDAGFWFAPQFCGERIPTLEEVLKMAKNRVPVNIEIKNPTHDQYPITELTDRALQEVRRAEMEGQVIFSSFHPLALEWIKRKEPRIWTALLYHRDWNSLRELTAGENYRVLNLRHTFLSRDKIAKIHKEGILVNVYTVNAEEELKKFVNWKVDGIITNYPDRLIKILREKFG